MSEIQKDKLFTNELTLASWLFWDLAAQKIIRAMTSIRVYCFNVILVICVKALYDGKITGDSFKTIVVSSLTVIALSLAATDLTMRYFDGKE